MLGTFEKARAVLDLYTKARPEWGVTEVARTLEMPTSSAHVLMSSLTHMGLLHRTPAGRYRLGFKLLALSQVLLSNTPWREVAKDAMQALYRKHGEALYLAAFDGGELVNVAKFDGRPPHGVLMPEVGAALPAYASASGRLLLAHRPLAVVRRVLNDLRSSGPDAQAVSEATQVLDSARREGYATFVDVSAGVWSVAAPVRNHNGEVVAALSLSVPDDAPALRRLQLQRDVLATGALISTQIGYTAELQGDERLLWISVAGRERLGASFRHRRRAR